MLLQGYRMRSHRLLLMMLVFGLFYFSEGKPCPEKTRPHKSRCDSYFKCMMLPSKSHVWVPEKCEQGLIYEPNLRMCVLPGDDWECNLGDSNKNGFLDDDNVVYGVGVDGFTRDVDDEQDIIRNTESPDGAADDMKGSDYIAVEGVSSLLDHEFEASGEGVGPDYIMVDTVPLESKTSNEDGDLPHVPSKTPIDPNLTAHLQRLSQLIDGLKQTYQNKDSAAADLRPDQLNAFLAHYNIKSQLDSLNPSESPVASTTVKSELNETLVDHQPSSTPSSSQLDPETKVVLTNQLPSGFNNLRPTDGYSNSQIVVNKPEGSVLFTLGNQPQDLVADHRYDPKISEETLKTVLELSKQMIENQNVRQILPNSAFYPHVVQPIYLPPPIPQYAQNMFNQHDGYDDKKYDKASSTYYVPQEKPEKPSTTIIHNNVITVPDKKDDQLDSYGQKLNSYPPLNDYQQYQNGGASSQDAQDHQLNNRYENNQLVTIRPNSYQNNYRPPTTTSRPYISDSGSTLTDYYTPSPHLDESNVNNVFQVERYPTINYGNIPSRPPPVSNSAPNFNRNRPQLFTPHTQQDNPYFPGYSPYQQYYYPNQQQLLQLFPTHLDASKVKIRPNSQKLESMEQETAEENDSDSGDGQDDRNASDDNRPETYNRYNVNKQIMGSQLAQYMEQLSGNGGNRPQAYGSSIPSRSRLPQLQQQANDDQLLGLNANLFDYGLLKTKLEDPKIDANSCPVGVRQPNATDCTKYYVCSREDSNVMHYSCPQFTAFNPQSRLCDAHYYAICHPGAVISRFTISENRRIQMEALKALQNAQRVREQALKAQNLALRIRLGESDGSGSTPSPPQLQPQYPSDVLTNFLQNAIDANSLSLPIGGGGGGGGAPPSMTPRPHGVAYGTSMATKKRKYYCKEGDKVADQTSIYSYFVCYKNAQGMMKGHKMTCSQGLLFCPMTTMCTLPTRCT